MLCVTHPWAYKWHVHHSLAPTATLADNALFVFFCLRGSFLLFNRGNIVIEHKKKQSELNLFYIYFIVIQFISRGREMHKWDALNTLCELLVPWLNDPQMTKQDMKNKEVVVQRSQKPILMQKVYAALSRIKSDVKDSTKYFDDLIDALKQHSVAMIDKSDDDVISSHALARLPVQVAVHSINKVNLQSNLSNMNSRSADIFQKQLWQRFRRLVTQVMTERKQHLAFVIAQLIRCIARLGSATSVPDAADTESIVSAHSHTSPVEQCSSTNAEENVAIILPSPTVSPALSEMSNIISDTNSSVSEFELNSDDNDVRGKAEQNRRFSQELLSAVRYHLTAAKFELEKRLSMGSVSALGGRHSNNCPPQPSSRFTPSSQSTDASASLGSDDKHVDTAAVQPLSAMSPPLLSDTENPRMLEYSRTNYFEQRRKKIHELKNGTRTPSVTASNSAGNSNREACHSSSGEKVSLQQSHLHKGEGMLAWEATAVGMIERFYSSCTSEPIRLSPSTPTFPSPPPVHEHIHKMQKKRRNAKTSHARSASQTIDFSNSKQGYRCGHDRFSEDAIDSACYAELLSARKNNNTPLLIQYIDLHSADVHSTSKCNSSLLNNAAAQTARRGNPHAFRLRIGGSSHSAAGTAMSRSASSTKNSPSRSSSSMRNNQYINVVRRLAGDGPATRYGDTSTDATSDFPTPPCRMQHASKFRPQVGRLRVSDVANCYIHVERPRTSTGNGQSLTTALTPNPHPPLHRTAARRPNTAMAVTRYQNHEQRVDHNHPHTRRLPLDRTSSVNNDIQIDFEDLNPGRRGRYGKNILSRYESRKDECTGGDGVLQKHHGRPFIAATPRTSATCAASQLIPVGGRVAAPEETRQLNNRKLIYLESKLRWRF